MIEVKGTFAEIVNDLKSILPEPGKSVEVRITLTQDISSRRLFRTIHDGHDHIIDDD